MSHSNHFFQRTCYVTFLVAALSLCTLGCRSNGYLIERNARLNPLTNSLQLQSWSGPQATERSEQLLRRYDLAKLQEEDPEQTLQLLQGEIRQEPTAEKMYTFAELAYVAGQRAQKKKQWERAQDYYAACVAHAYLFLFDQQFDQSRNPYDPRFRGACDLYNDALESALRIARDSGMLKPGTTNQIQVGDRTYHVRVELRGSWACQEFDRFEFVSDYDVRKLTNHYRSYGLGVPLIAVRAKPQEATPAESYLPPGLSYAATAFLRVTNPQGAFAEGEQGDCHCVLELYNSMQTNHVELSQRLVPLETDLSTPLAYFLDNKQFHASQDTSTLGLLDPTKAQGARGLYMLEAYDPEKIPVLMVHGLWSSPLTWMQMFNDLRAYPEIRDHYQFWFYLYPTGQPFWSSARQMREDLAACRLKLDPEHQTEALDHMVLVGHSMGGLVSRLQTIESGNDFWQIVSDEPFESLKADPEQKELIAKTLFFEPNPDIKQVVTIGTPHRGSEFANDYTRWLGRHLIQMPKMLEDLSMKITRDNPGLFRDPELLKTSNSIDSLSPEAPILPVMIEARKAPWVKFHNIVGVLDEDTWVGSVATRGDGIVPYASAHLDDVISEIVVDADHVNVHQHPRSVLHVRDILRSHLTQVIAELQERRLVAEQRANGVAPVLPAGQSNRPLTR